MDADLRKQRERPTRRPDPDHVADLIREGIRTRVLGPGQALIQDELAKRLGVSRNPVREALRTVAAEGLVTLVPGSGAIVRALSRVEVEELYGLRLLIEPPLAVPIVQHAREADIGSLARIADQVANAGDMDEWLRENFRFHNTMLRLSGRPNTSRILEGLLTLVVPYSRINVEALGGRDKAISDHFEMIDAIRDRDPDRLATLFTDHMQHALDALLASPDDTELGDPLHLLRGLGGQAGEQDTPA